MAATPAPAAAEPTTQTAVQIRGLVKSFGKVRAVDGADLDVPAGGIFGLIGPNGAGKTTTMLMTVTLLRPDQGTVSVFDLDPVRQPRDVRSVVGYMPDFFGLYEGLTSAEYLDFFASAFGLDTPTRRRQVTDLLDLVGLTHKADADTSTLSRGMQQRLSLARALVHDPKLLVLDEPASGLDPRARIELREILLELARQGKTILISSHILAELEEMCDRVAIIDSGKVLAQGLPDEIRASLAGSLIVKLRVIGGDEATARAEGIAAGHGAVGVTRQNGGLRIELAGGDDAAADLLSALVAAGVRVVDFREERGNFERMFLSVTKGTES